MIFNLKKKQAIAIAIIVVAGLLASVLILFSDKHESSADGHAGHAHGTTRSEDKNDVRTAGGAPDATGGNGRDHRDQDAEKPAADKAKSVALTDAQIKAAGIKILAADGATIRVASQLPGEIRFNDDRTAHIVPRVAGVVQSVPADLGQSVKKGQVLAVIASTAVSEQRSELAAAQKRLRLAQLTYEREKTLWQDKISAEQDYLQARQALQEAEIASQNARQKLAAIGAEGVGNGELNRFEIRAPFDGMVLEKHISLGEALKEDAPIFTVSDLSTVWAEIAIPARDLNRVRVGEKVLVKADAFDSSAAGTVSYVGSLLGAATRTATARVTLVNPQGTWRPGLFVNVEVVTAEAEVAVAVPVGALHRINERDVIFVRTADGFKEQVVKTGRTDGKLTEIVDGLNAGTEYAADGSFIVRSELGKADAVHVH